MTISKQYRKKIAEKGKEIEDYANPEQPYDEDELDQMLDEWEDRQPTIGRTEAESLRFEVSVHPQSYAREINGVSTQTLAELHERCQDMMNGNFSSVKSEKDGLALVPGIIEEGPDKRQYSREGDENGSHREQGLWRQTQCVRGAQCLIFDIEDHPISDNPDEIKQWLEDRIEGTDMLLWSSWHHGTPHKVSNGTVDTSEEKWSSGEPRFRLLIPLTREVDVEEYELVWDYVAEEVLDGAPDEGTNDTTRICYLPRPPHDHMEPEVDPFVERIDHGGTGLDPDDLPGGESAEDLIEARREREKERKEAREERLRKLRERNVEIPDSDSEAAKRHAERKIDEAIEEIEAAEKGERHHTIRGLACHPLGALDLAGVIDILDDDLIDRIGEAVPGIISDPSRGRSEIVGLLRTGRSYAEEHVGPYDMERILEDADASDDEGRPVFSDPDALDFSRTFLDRYPGGWDLHFSRQQWWDWDEDRFIYDPIPAGDETLTHFASFLRDWNGALIMDGDSTKRLEVGSGFYANTLQEARISLLPREQQFEGALDGPPAIACRDGVWTFDEESESSEVVTDPDEAKEVKATRHADCHLVKDPEPTAWLKILESVWGDDEDFEEKKRFLQEWIGACLLGLAPEYNTGIILLGQGSNGKSTVLNLIRQMWPDDAWSVLPVQQWDQRFQKQELLNSTINLVEEMPGRDIVGSSAFKNVVEGGPVWIERKGEDGFRTDLEAGHIFAANNLPSVSDASHGFWRRWRILEFNRRFDEEEQRNFELDEQVDLDALFSWFVEGGARLLARGRSQGDLPDVPSSREAKRRWRSDTDPVADFCQRYLRELHDDERGRDGLTPDTIWERWTDTYVEETNSGGGYKRNTVMSRIEKHMGVERGRPRSEEGRVTRLPVTWDDNDPDDEGLVTDDGLKPDKLVAEIN